jgi:hypothetical protein
MLRRRPIARTAVRTAVVAGTATAVSGRVARRQQARAGYSGQDEPSPEAQSGGGVSTGSDTVEQLKDLAALRDQGVITDEEFAAGKAKILG